MHGIHHKIYAQLAIRYQIKIAITVYQTQNRLLLCGEAQAKVATIVY